MGFLQHKYKYYIPFKSEPLMPEPSSPRSQKLLDQLPHQALFVLHQKNHVHWAKRYAVWKPALASSPPEQEGFFD
jgi:hypothetical protein